jgi:hypothetical protein
MSNGWDFKCNVSTIIIDVEGRVGYLHLPELNFPDMSSTIKNFTSADPEIEVIQTIVDGVHDVKYVKTEEGWVAAHE